MDTEQIRKTYSEKPKMRNYLIILVALLLIVAFYFVLNNYQLLPEALTQGEQPPALPDAPNAPGTGENLDTPPFPPEPPQFPS